MNKNATVWFVVLSIVIASVAAIALGKSSSQPTPEDASQAPLASFAQCVAQSGLTMYGAEWCPHCKKEKARFGAAFSFVPYVECPENTKLCIDKGINGYPTWIDSSGKKYEGEQGLERIAEISNCALPESRE